VGTKGTILANGSGGGPRLLPESRMKEFLKKRPPKTLPRVKGGHYWDWIQSCKADGRPASSSFGIAGPLTEAVLLGNVAIRTGKRIEWDSETMRVTNLPEANQYIRSPQREF